MYQKSITNIFQKLFLYFDNYLNTPENEKKNPNSFNVLHFNKGVLYHIRNN